MWEGKLGLPTRAARSESQTQERRRAQQPGFREGTGTGSVRGQGRAP